jgi:hypothetical protein
MNQHASEESDRKGETIMCCCGKPIINGQVGYKWNQPDGPEGVYPVNAPELEASDRLLRDEPGRCGGTDAHSHHYRLVKSEGGSLSLLVRHGCGDERVRVSRTVEKVLLEADSNTCYWLLSAIYHAYSDGAHAARSATARTWQKAAAEKRIKTRKQRGSDRVKVWIERADVTDMRNALVLNQ